MNWLVPLVCTLASCRCADPPPERFDEQGHRGARGLRPENTLPAFELALDLQVSTLELDVHLSRDDVVMVWHDPFVDPAKCDAHHRERLRDLTRDQLAQLRCDRNPDPERFPEQRPVGGALSRTAYHIATLEQLFDLVERYGSDARKTRAQRHNARKVRFNIETKRVPDHPEYIDDGFDGVHPGLLETLIVKLAQRRGLMDRITLQSFDHRSLRAAHILRPTLSLSALTNRDVELDTVAQTGAQIWSPDAKHATAANIARAHRLGMRVIPWTVNDAKRMRTLIDRGVDGIITDRPDRLRAIVHPRAGTSPRPR